MSYDINNVFAKILQGELNVEKIFENEILLAFPDIKPVAEIHIIAIPKKPYTCYSDFIQNANPEEISLFFKSIDYIMQKYNNIDYKIITNKGPNAGQTIFHFHCHIIAGKLYKDMVV